MKQIGSGVRHASGRDRLLAMARDLFMRRGASNVGINDVTDAAGVAKMTLYNNFESKEALVLAVYKEMIEATLRDLQQISKAGRSEEKLILGVFDYLDSKAGQDSYRGCPFIHASLQDGEPSGAVYELVSSFKRTLREHMFGLLDKSRRNRAELADQLLILLDGAETERYLKSDKQFYELCKAGCQSVAPVQGLLFGDRAASVSLIDAALQISRTANQGIGIDSVISSMKGDAGVDHSSFNRRFC